MIARGLRTAGVLGMNRRNIAYIMRCNPRRHLQLVDDKVRTKQLCREAGVATPETFGVVRHHFEVRTLERIVEGADSFVVKPAHGCQGNGILVIRERRGRRFVTGGRELSLEDVAFRVFEILSGLFSLGGQEDQALVEECLTVHPALGRISHGGVPDLRIVVYRGIPVLAMVRLPTARSGGRANLHQGAIGAGVDLQSGKTVHAVMRDRAVTTHPDTGEPVLGVELPGFETALSIAVRAGEGCPLGYLGVDVVFDERRGPVVLELNARPGLSIQLANRAGLLPRLDSVDRLDPRGMTVAERVRAGRDLACGA